MAEGEDRPRSGFGGAMTGALAAAAIVAAGLLWWAMQSPDPAVPPEPQLAATPAPAPAAAPAPASAPAQPAAPVPQPAAAAPADVVRFDLLRAAPDGSVTVAGAVAPGAQVEVLLDGQVADVLTAGADGRFASVLIGAPTAAPRELKVRVTGADGAAALSAQSLTVAPDPEAVTKAAAAAGAAPETVADQVAQAEALAAKPLVADADGVRVLAAASNDLVIDTLAFDAEGRVEISGRGAPAGSVLRAYVDNAEAGLTAPGTDGSWRMLLPRPKAGMHALRVDALDAQGNVQTRAETEFVSAAPEALRAEAGGGAQSVTIGKGVTLWAIAREAYGDPFMYVRVFEANRDQIRDPNLIYPGQVFTLPAAISK
jgi:nucleoid-associated protein YgaU